MFKINSDILSYVNLMIDANQGIDDFDRDIITAKIIQATPLPCLPTVDEMDTEGLLLDMLAKYMRTYDPILGQDILDYMAKNATNYFAPTIDNIIEERWQASQPARMERADTDNRLQYQWDKSR